MPKFVELSKAEMEELSRRRAPTLTIDLTEYVEYIKPLKPGEWGKVTLQKDETSRVIKRRITAAAKQLGKKIRYRDSADEKTILFRVIGEEGKPASRRGRKSGSPETGS